MLCSWSMKFVPSQKQNVYMSINSSETVKKRYIKKQTIRTKRLFGKERETIKIYNQHRIIHLDR